MKEKLCPWYHRNASQKKKCTIYLSKRQNGKKMEKCVNKNFNKRDMCHCIKSNDISSYKKALEKENRNFWKVYFQFE